MPRRGSLPWREDPAILARLDQVERAHLRGDPNTSIALALKVDEKTIRNDLDRLREIWIERTGDKVEAMRARVVAELEDERQRAIAAAEFDEAAERAVLYGDSVDDEETTDLDGKPFKNRVVRDMKGSAQFRGQKAQALKAAIDATLGKAKVLGLIIEKQEHSGEILVRKYVGVDIDTV